MGQIIAVANQKGGVGKTTTAINLAACLARYEDKRVLVVDIDPQGNATSGLGIDKKEVKESTYQVLIEDLPARQAVYHTGIEGLHVIPSTIDLAGAQIELVPHISRETRLRSALEEVKSDYDYLFIDCPPSLGLLTVNALTAADKVLVPIQCEYYALEGVSQLLNSIELVQENLNSNLELGGVVLTMFDGRTNLSIEVVEEVKGHFRDKVYTTVIPRNVRLSEAPGHGETIVEYDDRSRGAESYMELAKEVVADG